MKELGAPTVSILIVQYKRPAVFHGSSDPSVETLVRDNTDDNIGFSRGMNLLLQRARGKYVLFLDPDVQPLNDDWIDDLIQTADADPKIGIVQAKTLKPNGLLDSTGHELVTNPILFMHNRGEGEIDKGQYDLSTELASAEFTCTLVKREVLNSVGLLDPRLFLYHQDVDFCLRARRAGWRIVYAPRVVAIHDRGTHSSLVELANILRIYRKNSMWSNIAAWFFWNMLGALAGAKNRDFAYMMMRLRLIVVGSQHLFSTMDP